MAVIAAVFFGAFGYLFWFGSNSGVESDLADLRKHGFATSIPELYARDAGLKDASDSFKEFIDAEATLGDKAFTKANATLKNPGPSSISAARAMDELAPLVAPCLRAGACQTWHVQPEVWTPTSPYEYNITRADEACRMMCNLAIANHRLGRRRECLADLKVAAAIQRHIESNVVGSTSLTFNFSGEEYDLMETVRTIAAGGRNDVHTLEDMRTFLTDLQPLPDLKEVANKWFLADLASLREYLDASLFSDFKIKNIKRRFVARRQAAAFVHHWRNNVGALPSKDWDWEQAANVFYQVRTYGGSNLEFFAGACVTRGVSITNRRILSTAVEILLAKAKKGSLPATISDLGASSIDPFTGKSLGYLVRGSSFLLYGAGPNKKVEEAQDGPTEDSDDIAVQFSA